MEKQEIILARDLSLGSTQAFETLYSIYSPKIMSFTLSYTKSREISEEIVQDVFVSLWQNRENIKKHNSISSLIFTIAKNKLISNFRKTVNLPIYEEYINYCDSLTASVNNITHKIEFEEFMARLNNITSNLTKTQRDVFRLSKIENLSNQEIADKLNISYQTVRNQLSLALKQIKEELILAVIMLIKSIL